MKLYTLYSRYVNSSNERSSKARRNIVKMFFINGLSILISLVNVPIFLSCLDNTRYGIWVTILSIVNWIGFLDIGFGQGLRNKLSESLAVNNVKKSKELISTTYAFVSLIFFSLILIILATSRIIDWSKIVNSPLELKNEVNTTFLIVISLMSISFITRILNSVLQSLQIPSVSSMISLVGQIICLIAIYLVSRLVESPSLVLFGIIMTGLPALVTIGYTFYLFQFKYQHLAPQITLVRLNYSKEILSLGLYFFLIQVFGIMLTQTGNIIISNVSGPEFVPEYYIATRYFNILMMFFMIVTTPFWSATTEAIVKNDYEWINRSYKSLLKVFYVTIVIGAIMLFISPYIIKIWTGDRVKVRFIVAVLSYLYMLLFMLNNIYVTFINGFGKIRMQLIIVIATSLINIVLSIYLCGKLGAIGIFITLVIVYLITFIWSHKQFMLLIKNSATGIWNR